MIGQMSMLEMLGGYDTPTIQPSDGAVGWFVECVHYVVNNSDDVRDAHVVARARKVRLQDWGVDQYAWHTIDSKAYMGGSRWDLRRKLFKRMPNDYEILRCAREMLAKDARYEDVPVIVDGRV